MNSIVLATYSEYPKLTDSDKLLVKPFQQLNMYVEVIPWDKRNVDWEQFDAVILRSCWNYHLHYQQFIDWLDNLQNQHVSVWNPIPLLRWNSKKTYLEDIEKKGISIIPTKWVQQNEAVDVQKLLIETNLDQWIVKPAVGASAYEVHSFTKDEIEKAEQKIQELSKQTTVLIQPFMKEIEQGEYSIVFIGNAYSHTVQKKPKAGEFRSNYKYEPEITLANLDNTFIEQAKQIYGQLDIDTLYARLDFIMVEKKLVMMELELIEPNLFFDLSPQAATTFAKACVQKKATSSK